MRQDPQAVAYLSSDKTYESDRAEEADVSSGDLPTGHA